MNSTFAEKYSEWLRKGDSEKVNWIKNMDRVLLPSLRERVRQNDKTVLREIVLPKWIDWELLREIVENKPIKNEKNNRACILCDRLHELGLHFNEKFICESCFLKLKHLDVHTQLATELNPAQPKPVIDAAITLEPSRELEQGPNV